jgi:hypothetical protein
MRLWGDRPPVLGKRVELVGGRVWYPVKAHRNNGHNLSIETDMLSRFIYEQNAWQILGLGTRPPNWGEGVQLGGQKLSHSTLYYWFHISSPW